MDLSQGSCKPHISHLIELHVWTFRKHLPGQAEPGCSLALKLDRGSRAGAHAQGARGRGGAARPLVPAFFLKLRASPPPPSWLSKRHFLFCCSFFPAPSVPFFHPTLTPGIPAVPGAYLSQERQRFGSSWKTFASSVGRPEC